jgi:chromosome partitioning protein
MGRRGIISIVNHKGGVGKTTTAVNLGHALALEGQRVLVVDMDPQCNASDILLPDLEVRRGVFDLLNPDEAQPAIEDLVYGTSAESLHCLPNVSDSALLEAELIRMGHRGFRLLRDRLREYAAAHFDITLIDNPPNMGTFVAVSLLASDFVLVPNEAGSTAGVRGVQTALSFIDEIRESGNPAIRFLGVLVTKVDRRTPICQDVMQEIRKCVGEDRVFSTTIPINTEFQRSEFHRRSVFQSKPNAPGGRAYRDLAREILARLSD